MKTSSGVSHKDVRIVLATLCLLAAILFVLPFLRELQPLGLSLRAVGAVCLLGACVIAFMHNAEKKTNIIAGTSIIIVSFLVALALAFSQIPFASASEIQTNASEEVGNNTAAEIVEYEEPDFDKIASANDNLVELKSIGEEILLPVSNMRGNRR